MSDIIIASSESKLAVPPPKEEMTTRLATVEDIPFIDELQKKYNKNLGFMPKMWLENKIKANHILIGEVNQDRVGYIIAQDRYQKRDELGIVYQLVVAPGKQRSFIGAALLKAQFDRSQYGCRLYCCWCAQDLEANHFWTSMWLSPLAFRNGAEKKGKDGKHRVHIFWEKKIRGKGDAVNWWFPAKTDGGAIGADRLALPIPPGVHWSEVEPIEIPVIGGGKLIVDKSKSAVTTEKKKPAPKPPAIIGLGRMGSSKPVAAKESTEKLVKEKKPRSPKVKAKIDPVFISKSKELRDKYLEQVNEHGYKLESAGKYELTRKLPERSSKKNTAMLEAA